MRLVALFLVIAAGALQAQEISHTTPPKVVHTVRPQYTQEAIDAKLEGDVVVSLIVGVDGLPSDLKVLRGLGMGLDEAAVECLRQWRFSPATNYFAEPVEQKVTIEVNFRLSDPSERSQTSRDKK